MVREILQLFSILLAVCLLFPSFIKAETIGKKETQQLQNYACISADADKKREEIITTISRYLSSQYYETFREKFTQNGLIDEAESYAQELLKEIEPKLKTMAKDIYEVGTLDEYCTEKRIEKIKNQL